MGASIAVGLALAAGPADHSVSLMGEGTELVQQGLVDGGYAVTPMNVRWPEACDGVLAEAGCWTVLRDAWELTGEPTRFMVAARVRPLSAGHRVEVIVVDGRERILVADLDAFQADDDLVFPLTVGPEVVYRIDDYLDPAPPPTRAELDELARLDGPTAISVPGPVLPPTPEPIDVDPIDVDLRRDFKAFCRTGPRHRRTEDTPFDGRPRCQLGPFFGYWTGASWATLAFLTGSIAATGVAFGLHPTAPAENRPGLAIGGSVAAGFSAVLTGALIGRIIRDRRRARSYIRDEKALAQFAGL